MLKDNFKIQGVAEEPTGLICSLCGAKAIIFEKFGNPICRNFQDHIDNGDQFNLITEMSDNEHNFWNDMLEDYPENHITEAQNKKKGIN